MKHSSSPAIIQNISLYPVVQWFIKWINLPAEYATCEDATFIQKVFPALHP
jgi:hypothetical protein